MAKEKDIVQKIIEAASEGGEFKLPATTGVLQRYQDFLSRYIEAHEASNPEKTRRRLLTLESVLLALGAALGFFIIYNGVEEGYKTALWIVYVIVVASVSITLRFIPETLGIFYLHAQQIRLTNLAERLAAEVALFDLIGEPNPKDDEAFISSVSKHMPVLTQLDSRGTGIIQNCLDTSKTFDSSRETNIIFNGLDLESEQEEALFHATRRLVELCSYLFAGKEFTAKLYLRTRSKFEDSSVEILTSFAKYPADFSRRNGPYGSSWVKARGHPSKVWACLESGKALDVQGQSYGVYYNSMLLICLPGRVGVLAITSASENAFKDKYDEWLVKSLATAARTLTAKALGLGG